MSFDPAQNHFAESPHGSVFFPWAAFFACGALWAFEVQTDETRRRLSRQVRWYNFSTLVLLVIAVTIGVPFNLAWPSFAASFILPLIGYSFCVRRVTKTLVRIPLQESLALFAAKTGAVRLWQNVLLGVIFVVLTVWFSTGTPELIASAFALTVNSVVAVYALRKL
jgi:hypothetical protein